MKRLLNVLSDEEVLSRMKECMDAVHERFAPMLACEIRDMAPELDPGDVHLAARFALRRAAAGWDPKQAKFETYAKRSVRNAIITVKRQEATRLRKLGDPLSLDGPTTTGGEEFTMGATIADPSSLEHVTVDALALRQSDYMQRWLVESAVTEARNTIGVLYDPWEWLHEVLGRAGWPHVVRGETEWLKFIQAKRLMVDEPGRGDIVLRPGLVGFVFGVEDRDVECVVCDGSVQVLRFAPEEQVATFVRWRCEV